MLPSRCLSLTAAMSMVSFLAIISTAQETPPVPSMTLPSAQRARLEANRGGAARLAAHPDDPQEPARDRRIAGRDPPLAGRGLNPRGIARLVPAVECWKTVPGRATFRRSRSMARVVRFHETGGPEVLKL